VARLAAAEAWYYYGIHNLPTGRVNETWWLHRRMKRAAWRQHPEGYDK
jgi:hypothetical protein